MDKAISRKSMLLHRASESILINFSLWVVNV